MFAKRGSPSSHLVGLISDTHGLIRPEALDALRNSDLIVHCGDIGDPAVLVALQKLAPVRAIRGNNDKGAWAFSLPTCDLVEVGTHVIYVLHNLAELRPRSSCRWLHRCRLRPLSQACYR
jgi:putative phosphoesterase